MIEKELFEFEFFYHVFVIKQSRTEDLAGYIKNHVGT